MSMSIRSRCAPRLRAATALLLFTSIAHVSHAQVNVLTQHNDNLRTGANLNEQVLTTANVKSSFGKLFCVPVDGFVFAQPLYMSNLSIPGAGTHNVLFVATTQDSVYAFDADNGALLWKASTSTLGIPVEYAKIGDPNIQANVGIISTPVIDPATNTLYVVAKTSEDQSGNACQPPQSGPNPCVPVFHLHALSVTTGGEKFSGPVKISGSVVNASGATVSFNAESENQRAALTLANGLVYVAFGSYGDENQPYYGWVMAYSAANLAAAPAVFNVAPNATQSSIWMSGQGLVADGAGSVYFLTGNSSAFGQTDRSDYGEAFVKLSGNTLSPVVGWKPDNFMFLNMYDLDLGAGGLLEIPNTTYLVGGGKEGMLHVVDASALTEVLGSPFRIVTHPIQVDADVNPPPGTPAPQWGLWGAPVFWNSAAQPTLYVWPVQDGTLKAFNYNGSGQFSPASTSSVAINIPGLVAGDDPCGALSISANQGTAGTGIVWAAAPVDDPDHATARGALYAFDAGNVGTELWDSRQNPVRDDFQYFAKFVPPTIASGKVYVATDAYQVCVYGLNPPAPAWHHTDINLLANATPATGAFRSYSLGAQLVVYRGNDSHLEQLSSVGNQSQWFRTDLTPLTGAPALAGSPSGYVIDGEQAVVFRGNDGHIYQVSTGGGNTSWFSFASDLSTLGSAPAAAGDPIGYVIAGNQYVDYLGTDGHIHQVFTINNNTQWESADLTALAGAPPSAGNPYFYAFAGEIQIVIFRGTDNDIHQLETTDNTHWSHIDASAASGAPPAAGDPSAYVFGNQIVNYRGTDGHIHQIWSPNTNGPWGTADLTVITGAVAAAGDPSSYTSGAQLIVYLGADSHVHQLSTYNNNTQWADVDIGSLAGGPSAAASPVGYVFINQEVVYAGTDGHIHDLYVQ